MYLIIIINKIMSTQTKAEKKLENINFILPTNEDILQEAIEEARVRGLSSFFYQSS